VYRLINDLMTGNLILHEAGDYSVSLEGDALFKSECEDRSVLASLDKAQYDYWETWVGIPATVH